MHTPFLKKLKLFKEIEITHTTNIQFQQATMTNQLFNFGENNIAKLKEFLEIKNKKSESLEFEIRLGSFQYDKNTKRSNFIAGCEIDFFYKLMSSFDRKGFAKEIKNTNEKIYSHMNGSLKVTTENDPIENGSIEKETQTYMMKNMYKKHFDVYDYDLRLSLASEETFDSEKAIEIISNQESVCERNKERTSFFFPCGRVDFTIVNYPQNPKETIYELEFEVFEKATLPDVVNMITMLLQTRQDSFYVITNFQKRNIIMQYKKLLNLKHSVFVGAQPETLQKNKISNLYKQVYSVTDKADGDRCFMHIDDKGHVAFLDANIDKIWMSNLKSSEFSNCIIDGERINHNGRILFMAFDILVINNKDIRGNNDYFLQQRLLLLEKIIKTIPESSMYSAKMKTFYFVNVFLGSQIILETINDKPYKNDGLIFTPMNEPYPLMRKWSNLLKWKPASLNTIDFYAVRENDGMWKLYVQHTVPSPADSHHQQSELVLFDIQKLCKNIPPVDVMTFQTSMPDNAIDPSTGYPFKTNTVIEFKWENFKFVPLKTRWDKTANPRKHGNFSAVALDVWNNIHNPIEQDLLFKFSVGSNKEDQYFDKMRKFHNKVKEYMYSKYTKNCESMLELCSGRGGDMHKWVHNNIHNIVGYDISERNIAECQRRWGELKAKHELQFNYSFHKLDLCSNKALGKIYEQSPNRFNAVSCQFGIHYFFGSDDTISNIINILDATLEPDGYFMITFMDNKCIDELLHEKSVYFNESNNEIQYMIKRNFNQIKIILNGNSILSEGSNEYIIDFDAFCNLMNAKGYRVVETELFKNLPPSNFPELNNLKEFEKDISFLNRYCIFQKSTSQCTIPVLDVVVQPCQNVLPKQPEMIDIQQKNLAFFKLSTKYDVIDIINCIKYKCYKQMIDNKEIESYDDIANIFQEFALDFSPKYITNPLNINEYESRNEHMYFTNYKHVVEKRSDEQSEPQQQEYTNWYVIMHNNTLLFSKNAFQENENTLPIENLTISSDKRDEHDKREESILTENLTNKDVVENLTNKDIVENLTNKDVVNESNEKQVSIELLLNGKITIKTLKPLLAKYGLRCDGKKEEMKERLVNYLTNQNKTELV